MVYDVYEPKLHKTISFRKAGLDDIGLVHTWMNEDHVHPFWHLNVPLPEFRTHFEKALSDGHQALYLGMIDGIPMSYWEAYWVEGDVLQGTYPNHPYDQGVHLLIGDKRFLGKGLALPLLKEMVRFLFEESKTVKVMAEPDIRNEKMIHVFKTCGFIPLKPVQLPDKTGLLMSCERKEFERRWS